MPQPNEQLCRLLRQRIADAGIPIAELARRLGSTCHRLGLVLSGEGMVTSGHLVSLLGYFMPPITESREWLRLWTAARFLKTGAIGLEWVDSAFGSVGGAAAAAAAAPPGPARPASCLPTVEGELEELRLLKRRLSPVTRAAEAHLAIMKALCASSDATAEEILTRVDRSKIAFAETEVGYIRDVLAALTKRGYVEQSGRDVRRVVSGKPKMQRILISRLSVIGVALLTLIERKEQRLEGSVAR